MRLEGGTNDKHRQAVVYTITPTNVKNAVRSTGIQSTIALYFGNRELFVQGDGFDLAQPIEGVEFGRIRARGKGDLYDMLPQAGAALAQTLDQPEATSSPVAYVYVSRPTHIGGFAASTTGKLTAVPGSPFSGSVSSMSVNGKSLFGAGDNGKDIYSFSIGSSGALTAG